MKNLVRLLALLSVLTSVVVFYRPRPELRGALMLPKLMAGALSSYGALAGAVAAAVGLLVRSRLAFLAGGIGATMLALHVRRTTALDRGFQKTFGRDWRRNVPGDVAFQVLDRRWEWCLPISGAVRWERDLPFWIVPGTDRRLLCDLWQPPPGIRPSGIALVYLHGGYWHFLDKDVQTRPAFRHLASMGHVVMDVAYRLCPEVQVHGMVHDAKRAVAWMKRNGSRYGVNPERVVIAGSSAGAHLALLAAYAPHHLTLTPEDTRGVDLSVRGAVSFYGPPCLRPDDPEVRELMGWSDLDLARIMRGRDGRRSTGLGGAVQTMLQKVAFVAVSHEQMMVDLLGGLPEEVPEVYSLASPITHVHPGCPPTLLVHGEHDSMVPVEYARALHRKLARAGVPVVYREFPRTEHGFDLTLPRLSPPAQAALFDLTLFLTLLG